LIGFEGWSSLGKEIATASLAGSLAMTWIGCHCEERSDEAISLKLPRLRLARNCKEWGNLPLNINKAFFSLFCK
jgi:hypothetical protein